MSEDKKNTIITIIVVVIFCVLYLTMCGDRGSSSGTKWSDLSDTEKANAKWAYEVKQEIDSRK